MRHGGEGSHIDPIYMCMYIDIMIYYIFTKGQSQSASLCLVNLRVTVRLVPHHQFKMVVVISAALN